VFSDSPGCTRTVVPPCALQPDGPVARDGAAASFWVEAEAGVFATGAAGEIRAAV
jgi:hypothetical protein